MTRIKTKEVLEDHERRLKRMEEELYLPPPPKRKKKRRYYPKPLDAEQHGILNYVIARNGWEAQTIALTDLTKAFNEVYLKHHPEARPVHCRNILQGVDSTDVFKRHNKTYVKLGGASFPELYAPPLNALEYEEWTKEYKQREERRRQEWLERMG